MKHSLYQKRKKGEDNEWMITYADIITLLLAFFVILFSMSTLKKEMFAQISDEIVVGQQRSLSQKIMALKPVKDEEQSPVVYKVFVPPLDTDDFLHTVIGIEEQNLNHNSRLIFPEESVFAPETSTLVYRSKTVFEQTSDYLMQISPEYFLIGIEVHYDKESDVPRSYKNKYQFTAERALNFRNGLLKAGYKNENLYVVGYADTIPLKEKLNIDSSNPARRIVINIHRKTDPR